MPAFVLTVLKVTFLALLYFFVYRTIRVAVAEVRGPRAPKGSQPAQTSSRSSRQAKRGREPSSIVILGEDGKRVRTQKLTGTIQIGRAEACQIRLDDTYISQFHARIFDRGGGWYVEDLGSTNGTYLNQQRVTGPVPLQAGDRLKVGKVVMELRR